MENRWLLVWILAPLFSPGATAVEAWSLRWYVNDDNGFRRSSCDSHSPR
jgi:hypothetical protein